MEECSNQLYFITVLLFFLNCSPPSPFHAAIVSATSATAAAAVTIVPTIMANITATTQTFIMTVTTSAIFHHCFYCCGCYHYDYY